MVAASRIKWAHVFGECDSLASSHHLGAPGRHIFHHSNLFSPNWIAPKSHQCCDGQRILPGPSAAFLNTTGKEKLYTYNPTIHFIKITGVLMRMSSAFSSPKLLREQYEAQTLCSYSEEHNVKAKGVVNYHWNPDRWQNSQSHQQDSISARTGNINRNTHTLLIKAPIFCYVCPRNGLCLENVLISMLLHSLHYRKDK